MNAQVLWQHPSYEVLGELGRGGMGIVLRARHRELGTKLAVKLIDPHAADARAFVRFEREAQILARLRHPNIIAVHDFGTLHGAPFLVMDMVKGQELEEIVKKGAETPEPEWTADIFRQLADALTYCHASGIAHRDLKPSNVLIESSSGRPILLDFGLVVIGPNAQNAPGGSPQALTKTGEIVGTPWFMAPEQFDSAGEFGKPGPASDVWALGASLHYCLSGRLPFDGPSLMNIGMKLMTAEVPSLHEHAPDAPGWLAELCADCMQKDSRGRPSMAEVAQRLAAGGMARAPEPKRLPGAAVLAPVVALAVGLAVALAAGWALHQPPKLKPKPPPKAPPPLAFIEHLPAQVAAPSIELRGGFQGIRGVLSVGPRRIELKGPRFSKTIPLELGSNEILLEIPGPPAGSARAVIERLEVLSVGPKGHFQSLPEALRRAPDGATLRLAPGRYRGGFRIDRKLTIIGAGEDPRKVIISANNAPAISLSRGKLVLQSLSIENTRTRGFSNPAALEQTGGGLKLTDCHLKSQAATAFSIHGAKSEASALRCHFEDSKYGGVWASHAANLKLTECRILNSGLRGVKIQVKAELTMLRCIVEGSGRESPTDGQGIMVWEGARLTITDCQVRRNRGSGLLAGNLALVRASNCDFNDNAAFGVESSSKEPPRSILVSESRLERNRRGPTTGPAISRP